MDKSTGWNAALFNRYHCLDQHEPAQNPLKQLISAVQRCNALEASRTAQRPLALNISIPFCANACYHCTQKTTVTKDRSRSTAYLNSLEQEIRRVAQHISSEQPITQLHIGGGTPTFLNSVELRQLMRCLQDNFTIVSNNFNHYSIDIDPRETDWATMGVLRDIGFNRINIMVQALDPAVQRAINSLHTPEQTQAIVEAARTLQFRNVSISLIYGLPKQTAQSFAQTLKDIVQLAPDRIILQGFQHQPKKHPIQRRIDKKSLPSSAETAQILQTALEQLKQAGYQYIGMDHFALADDDLTIAQEDGTLRQNLQGYTLLTDGDTLGLGVTATSQIGDLYYSNSADLTLYQNACNAQQLPPAYGLLYSTHEKISQAIIQALNCQFYVDFTPIEQRYNLHIKDYFKQQWPQLQQMHNDGLLELTDSSLQITTQGRLLSCAVCRLFDRPAAQEIEQVSTAVI